MSFSFGMILQPFPMLGKMLRLTIMSTLKT